ncbi:MAG: leucine--tRNA ligase [Prevotellaceae bacterium]|jgi:leucyl-tRNA synthetase|nr:leucine--tRNA ligase [Prevotellaceae bacterium]
MEYDFRKIENKWQKYWAENKIYKVEINDKPKYYVLDMFPYPSGAGLHVGHPLGYIASDIFSRYKRLCGFNVLHPMGYDAYGLPAEQYAIQTGQHPSITTETNINRYRNQLDKIGFCFDWDREVRTCDPKYYKWTQWTFIKMFNSYYCNQAQQARPISELIEVFAQQGTRNLDLACSKQMQFTAEEWNLKNEKEQQEILLNYRIAYLADTTVNWCSALGTVLANDEVSEGLSIRGGYPVEQKIMKQWSLRVSAYAQRLLDDLEKLDWSESLKETQRNWIGRSEGAEVNFYIENLNTELPVFTTRADTVFGVTFMVLAPESEYVDKLTTDNQKQAVAQYLERTKHRTERERIADKSITGVFTGSYAINPVKGNKIPIWISDYVLAGYGTGMIMAVPAHDSRDYAFAKHFDLPVIPLIEGCDVSVESFDAKDGIMINSGFLNGLTVSQAIETAKKYIEENGIGKRKVNYRLRDAIFSRQRYWGEPFPVYYKQEMPYTLNEDKLPLELPEIDKFLPAETGEPPLGRAKNWQTAEGYPLELSTMPGFAGSSAYYLRYMDPHNDNRLVSAEANQYWRNVDLYVGGTEHATGHLIYSRFWNKFLFDCGLIVENEPFKKLVNQGMIQGRSNFVYRVKGTNRFVSLGLKDKYDTTEIHVDVNIVKNDILDIDRFTKWMPEFNDAEFILEDGKYICGYAIEKMSKSMYNVVNPDVIVDSYGADTLRMYEMFLGPIEQSKPWDTNGIDGVYRFLRRFWALYFDRDGNFNMSDEKANQQELKCLHKTIKKIQTDIENFSFNTSVSAFMICVNELMSLKCNKREILEPLVIILSPFAPHIAEELWHLCGHATSVCDAVFPKYNEEFLTENTFEYPVSFNGKMRFKKELPLTFTVKQVEEAIITDDTTQKWLDGKTPKKVIVVVGKIVNVVI